MNEFKILDLYDKLNDIFEEVQSDDYAKQFLKAIKDGSNKFAQKRILEAKIFDDSWIETIQNYYPVLDKICKSPKTSLKYNEEIEQIEKVKKTTSSSIIHLSSHTNLIKEIREDDFVVPEKLLDTQADINMETYENRFIKTLINRVFAFVLRQKTQLEENIITYQRDILNYNTNFDVQDSVVRLDINLTINEEVLAGTAYEKKVSQLAKIKFLEKLFLGLKSSPFMREMKNAKEINPPIIKTQIMLKNVDFKTAYNLWIFTELFEAKAAEIDVIEKNLPIDAKYVKDLQESALVAFTMIAANQEENREKYNLEAHKNKRRKENRQLLRVKDDLNSNEFDKNEEVQLNEYFLQKNREIFKKNLKKHTEQSSTKEVALKKALRDTTQIINALYQSFFTIAANEEFEDIVPSKEKNIKNFNDAKKKVKIARYIRDVKQVDFNNSIRLEKKWLRKLTDYNNRIIKEMQKADKNESSLKLYALSTKNLKKKKEILDKNLQEAKNKAISLNVDTTKLNEKYRENFKQLQLREKTLIKAANEKAANEYKALFKKLEEKNRQKIQMIKNNIKEAKQKLLDENKKSFLNEKVGN